MSSNSESESRIRQGLDERVAEEMERIDDEFLSGLSDSRLESGVPEDEQAQDLEFIQMSGLTYRDTGAEDASRAAGSQSPQPPDAAFRPAEPPLTFYEKGVADVDAEMTPGILEDSVPPEAGTIHGAEDSSPIAELRDIIADLSRDFVDSGAAPGPRAGAEENTELAGAPDESIREADDDPDAGQYPQSVAGDAALQEDGRLEVPGDHENDSASPSMTAFTEQEEAQEDAVEADPYWDEEIAAAKESQEPAEEQDKEADAAPDTDDPAEMPLADRPDDGSPEDSAGTGAALQVDSAFIDSPGGETTSGGDDAAGEDGAYADEAVPGATEEELAVMETDWPEEMPVGESPAESSDAVSENETLKYDEPETAPIVDDLNGALEDRFAAVMEDNHDESPVPDVREAEALIRELEAQPRADAGDDFHGGGPVPEDDSRPAARELPAALVPAAKHTVAEAPGASAAGERTVTRRRKSHTRGRLARRLIRLGVVLVVLAALAFGVYQAWLFAKQQLSTPDALLSQARIAAAREEHSGAAAHYKRAASLLPARDPRRAEALFGAALNVFSAGMEGGGGQKELRDALALLAEFQQEFPSHTKAARADTLRGIIYFELDESRQAIEVLRDPTLRLRDPGGALPILRTLARAHTKLGEYDMARRAYLQAARLEDNRKPDEDFEQVGLIYERLAEYSEEPAAQREHREMALEYWQYALESPGIDRVREDDLKRRISLIEAKLAGSEGQTGMTEGEADGTAPQSPPSNNSSPHGFVDKTPARQDGETSTAITGNGTPAADGEQGESARTDAGTGER